MPRRCGACWVKTNLKCANRETSRARNSKPTRSLSTRGFAPGTRSIATMSASYSSFQMVRAVWNAWALLRYLRRIIKKRRAAPQDDLISALLRVEEAGDRLAPNELVAMTLLLLLAGFETTVNLIGNGVLTLLQHPDQLEKLRNDPALIKPAVEEMLRFAGPIDTSTERYARQDITIAGTTIPRGEMVMVAIASANRDERQFAHPDSFDITRDPNKHLSFGAGTHFCLGAALARLEAQIAINALLRRAPHLRLAVPPDRLRWKPGLILRGLESLPVIFENTMVGLKASSAESVLKREGIPSA
jgi:cytochrome P450